MTQPTASQLLFAAESRRIAKTGVQKRIGTDYLDRCYRKHAETQCRITFARYANPGLGYWVQLTLTCMAPAGFEGQRITPQLEESWLLAFFGPDRPMVRTDLASSGFGRMMGTRHYRLFTDESYRHPYIPQKDIVLD